MIDEEHSLKDMALLVRRAGLEHLVTEADSEEIIALAAAGDELEMERAAYLAKALADPAEALRAFDGGAAIRARVKALAYEISWGGR